MPAFAHNASRQPASDQPSSSKPISAKPAGPDVGKPASRERRAATSLPCAMLLAFAGGSLDAFLYIAHGHVFAGAMTGNAVLCGIALLGGKHMEALHHALALMAFFFGVWGALLLEDHLRHHSVTVGLTCEIVGLIAASWLPRGFPDIVFVPVISLLAAYQVASFRKVDHYSYNSTFITGNLRTAVEGLYAARHPGKRQESLRKFRELALIVASFLLGAVAGALLVRRMVNHTLWLPAATLMVVLALVLRRYSQGDYGDLSARKQA